MKRKSISAHLPQDDAESLRSAAESGHGRHVSDRKPRANVLLAAAAAEMFLRHRRAGGDHPAGADRRENGASLFEAPAGARSRPECLHPSLKPVLARTLGVPLFQEQLLRMAMIAAGFYRRRGGRIAPRVWLQALGKTHEGSRSETAARDGAKRNHWRDAGYDRAIDHFICAVWISRIARGEFCADRVCQRLFEMPLSRGIHRGDAEQSADGILSVRQRW